MRLLTVADIHFNLRQLAWIEEVAEDYEAVILAGDLLDLTGHVPIEQQRRTMRQTLWRLSRRVPVLAVSGNHDVDGPDGEASWLVASAAPRVFVDGSTVAWKQLTVTLWPWSAESGHLPTPRRHAADQGPWFWVHHEPPARTRVCRCPPGRPEAGSSALVERIRWHRPTVVFAGHLHESPFLPGGRWWDRVGDTLVVNPGSLHGDVPAHVVTDLTEGTIRWVSPLGIDEMTLDLPTPLAGVA